MPTLEERLAKLQDQFRNMRIMGGPGVIVEGNTRHGFAVNIVAAPSGAGVGTTGGVALIPGCTDPAALNYNPSATVDDGSCFYEVTGACCIDEVCSITTETDCGGIYLGDFTLCSPNPCAPPTGACCDGSTCSVETESDCVDLIGGEYQGDDTTCSPNPCATGACCESGSCSIKTPDDCAGSYLGDDTTCSPNPCACPSISMTCDSISAAASKCGITDPSNPDKRYLGKTVDEESAGGYTRSQFCQTLQHFVNVTASWTYSNVEVTTASLPDCSESTENACSGLFCATFDEDCDQFGHCGSGTNCDPMCGWIFITPSGLCEVRYTGTGTCFFGAQFTCPVTTITYSSEYTTAMLISNVESALPPFSGVYTGGACASSRFLSSDEITYSVQRSKPRFTFSSSSVAFVLSYDEVFTPAGGGSPSTSSQAFTISAGTTTFDGPELFEPSSNGTTSIGNIQCTPV